MNWINLILSDILTVIGLYFFLRNLTREKYDIKSIIFFTFSSIILLLLNTILFEGITKVLFSIMIIVLITYFTLFKRKLNKSIYYSLLYIFISFVVEIIVTAFLITLFKYTMSNYENKEYSLLLFTLINTCILILITSNKKISNFVKVYEKKFIKNNIIKFYSLLITLITILIVRNNFLNYEKNLDYYINFAMLVFVIMVSIIVLYNKITKDKIEKKYEEMMEYVSKYEQIINEQGKKNHEFNNQLMVLNGYIGNEKKLKEYLDTIIKDHKGGKNYTIEQLSYFPDGGIKGLIYHKLSRMEENEIRPYLYISTDVKDIFETKFDVNTYSDITKLFGVYLDNAIEAAKDADKKEIEIDMKKDDKYLIVTISNTYSKDVDINKIGRKGFTTKGIGHGFGLSLVKDISKKNPKIETFNDVTDDMFKQNIMIDLK